MDVWRKDRNFSMFQVSVIEDLSFHNFFAFEFEQELRELSFVT